MARRSVGTTLTLVVSLAAGIPGGAQARTVAPDEPGDATPPSEPVAPGGEVAPEAAEAESPAASEPARDPETIRQEKRIEEAERHFIEGRTLYNQGRYLEAAAEFERSFAAIERAETLYNIVLSHELAGQPIPALRAARRYDALPDCAGIETGMCAKHRDKVRAIVRRLRPQVGEIKLAVRRGVEIREIRVNGRSVPQGDFPMLVMPGTYELEYRGAKPEHRRTRVIELYAGGTSDVDVGPFVDDTGEPVVGPTPPDGPDPIDLEEQKRRAERRRKALRGSFYAGLGLTVASGAATATFGALTLRARRLHEQQSCGTPCEDEEFPDTYDDVPPHIDRRAEFRQYKPITSALIGVTAALGVATAIVGIFAFTGQGSRRGSQRYGLQPGGLIVRW